MRGRDAIDERTDDRGAERRAATGSADGRWLTRGKDGRLTAYALTQGGMLRWTEVTPGGPRWSGPDFVPGAHLGSVTVVQGVDTYVHFLGRRAKPRADEGVDVDIVHAIQYQTGRPVTEWRSLGNPHKDRAKATRFGVPTGAVNSNGTVHVFARNAGGGLMMRREDKKGSWEAWTDLKGSRLADGVGAVPTSAGRIEVLAPSRSPLALHWYQTETDGEFHQAQDVPLAAPADGIVGLETGPDRLTYYWNDTGGNGIVAYRPGSWAISLGGAPAPSPVAALRTNLDGYDCTVLAHRAVDDQIMLAACVSENESQGLWWSPTGEQAVGAPALAVDAQGRVVLAVIGKDGALYVARQRREPGLALETSVRA
ncbi:MULTISPECIES: hypothetical protein [unclassified Streptomyces]|uniref:PLL-like beta propeller domain-containing protein n=1 Tax=Streptomyces sp. NBC_00119 TaxID=2975659 RepID=A0AAU1U4E5_9ACTN|nr:MULTISPECIES: hypothetical protein [unclassified Streptomyces]MCX4642510.1 hypothetical protein [Streptomyces sp. NBC_01446]MCX5327451.1 hypothetical protein [Streptomyces sp. NBC_00120]